MPRTPTILVLADLDDTLLDARSFCFDSATRRALQHVAHERIPVVLCSTKTRAELELIQRELHINHPFICENGAAVFVPRGYFGFSVPQARDIAGYEVAEFGKSYGEVIAAFHSATKRARTHAIGFNDMSVEEVAIQCGLSMLQARLAKLREYNEPFRVADASFATEGRLFKALRAEGLDCTRRGRYYYTGTAPREVGERFLSGLYRRAFRNMMIVAFGDHASAAALLRQADLQLVLQYRASLEATRLLTDVPTARISGADSIGRWAREILDIAEAARHRLGQCSS